jgi:hypothetical protein
VAESNEAHAPETASRITRSDESYYREHFDASAPPLADRRFEDVRPAYVLGHLAGYDPDYAGLEFDQIEAELERRWNDEQRARLAEWQAVRGFARAGYARGRTFADRLGDLSPRLGRSPDPGERGDSSAERSRPTAR